LRLKPDLPSFFKVSSLIVLIGILWWRDFPAFWQTLLSSGWSAITFIILFLVFVSLYQRRKALITLVLSSHNNNSLGVACLSMSLVLYVFGSYTPFAGWFHLGSMILFATGYIALVINSRILKMLILPFFALLFAVPPFSEGVLESQNLPVLIALHLSADAVIVVLVAYIIRASKWVRFKAFSSSGQTASTSAGMSNRDCPFCQSIAFTQEPFCPHCGNQLRAWKSERGTIKSAFLKFLVLLLITLAISYVYIPTLFLGNQQASLILYTSRGIEEQSIIPTPHAWTLESYERLVDYERERLEDYAALATYVWGESSENKSCIQLEIASKQPFMRSNWQNTSSLSGWRRTRQDVPLSPGLTGRYILLRKGNDTIAVFYWTMKLMFKVGSEGFSTRNVGVSVFLNFTEPLTEPRILGIRSELVLVGLSIIDSWTEANRWTFQQNTFNQFYIRFRDIILAIVGIVAISVSAGWVRTEDDRERKAIENACFLIKDEETMMVAISKMRKRSFLGKELYDSYRRTAKSASDINEFYQKLRMLSIYGVIKEDYAIENGQLIKAWKKTIL